MRSRDKLPKTKPDDNFTSPHDTDPGIIQIVPASAVNIKINKLCEEVQVELRKIELLNSKTFRDSIEKRKYSIAAKGLCRLTRRLMWVLTMSDACNKKQVSNCREIVHTSFCSIVPENGENCDLLKKYKNAICERFQILDKSIHTKSLFERESPAYNHAKKKPR